jgi:ABC-2 type transport system permease protein
MRAAAIIAWKDLTARIRDRTAIIVAIVAPFGLAAIFSVVIPSGSDDLNLRIGYADLDDSPVSRPLRDGPLAGLESAGVAAVVQLTDADAARAAVDQGDVDAAIVVPAGFGVDVQAGRGSQLEIIGDASGGTAVAVADAISEGFAARLEAIRLAVATALQADPAADPGVLVAQATAAVTSSEPIRIAASDAPLRRASSRTFYAGSMAIFFLFFTAQFGVLSLLTERRQGTLPRLLAAPIPPWAIVVGKALGSFVLGIVAMAVLVLASSLLLGARWGNPAAVTLLVLTAVLAATGVTALITGLSRTEEQAGGWNAIVATTLAILGGAFFPVSEGPEILRQISLVTPHAWFLRGLDELALPSAGIVEVVPSLAALTAFGLVCSAIGLWRARHLVVSR